MRTIGKLKFFIEDRHFRFFDDDKGERYFAHGNEFAKSGLRVPPDKGDQFSFEVERSTKGLCAINIAAED